MESSLILNETRLDSVAIIPKRGGVQITAETAVEYARKSAIARAAKKQAAIERANEPEPERAKLAPSEGNTEDHYRLKRLRITREQLETLDATLAGEDDPKAVKAICDSIARLSEVERQLAGRPAPGSHRPSAVKHAKPSPLGPIDSEPA